MSNIYSGILSTAHFTQKAELLASGKPLLEYFKNLKLNNNQYAYIINVATQSIPAAKGFDTFLGYTEENVDIDFIHGIIYREDEPRMRELIYAAWEFGMSLVFMNPFELQFSVDYRIVKKDKSVVRVNRFSTISEIDEKGKMLSTLSICTDISHLKKSNKISAKMYGHPEVEKFNKIYGTDNETISIPAREREILVCMAEGKITKEIASHLGISILTVETVRKRMMKKYNVLNAVHLVSWAKENGFI